MGGRRRPATKKSGAAQTWSARSEQRTILRVPGPEDRAAQTFRQLRFDEQLTLVKELVQTRAAELCRAYRDVVAVSHGLRRRTDPGTRRRAIVREPCVILVVKKKWARGRLGGKHRVPPYLFAYWDVGGVRSLCAVGTDVDDARERAAVRPEAATGHVLAEADGKTAHGVIACAIDRSVSGARYVISCQHVFSLTRVLAGTRFWPASVRLKDGAAFADTEDIRGDFDDAAARSLDCQLALVRDPAELNTALGGLRITDHLRNSDQALALGRCWIVTPSGPLEAHVKEPVGMEFSVDYATPGLRDVRHEELLLLHTTKPTQAGYSGSPVLDREDGGNLIGMHIAGNKNDLSIVIPAWHLLDPRRYRSTQPDETWQLVATV